MSWTPQSRAAVAYTRTANIGKSACAARERGTLCSDFICGNRLECSPRSHPTSHRTCPASTADGVTGVTGTLWPWLWLQDLPHPWGTQLAFPSVTQDQINAFKYGVSSIAVMPSIYKP